MRPGLVDGQPLERYLKDGNTAPGGQPRGIRVIRVIRGFSPDQENRWRQADKQASFHRCSSVVKNSFCQGGDVATGQGQSHG
jgi:hypothetical protein